MRWGTADATQNCTPTFPNLIFRLDQALDYTCKYNIMSMLQKYMWNIAEAYCLNLMAKCDNEMLSCRAISATSKTALIRLI